MKSQPVYLMPDGRPLAAVLDSNTTLETRRTGSNRKTRRGKDKRQAAEARWGKTSSESPGPDPETAEVLRLGRERRRRALSDKLLRDMAGNLTFHAIEALFKPAPFGDTGHVSPWTEAAYPENAHIISFFININMDAERKILERWEDSVRQSSHRGRDGAVAEVEQPEMGPSLEALRRWARISKKAREALKNANPLVVDELELPILNFLEGDVHSGPIEYRLMDSYHRLMVHGLAEYHGLYSHSSDEEGGGRLTVLRCFAGQAPSGTPHISCADIIMALEEQEGALTVESVRECMAQHIPEQEILRAMPARAVPAV